MRNWLPSAYTDVTSYFVDVVEFLNQYSWIFNWKVTHILIEDVFQNLPPEWLSALDSLTDNQLDELYKRKEFEVDWPSTLNRFLADCQKFRLTVQKGTSIRHKLDNHLKKGLSPKKEHEVVRLAALVDSECSKNNVNFVLDIGSGLGYLCEILHFVYGYTFLGLETDPRKTARANERHKDFERLLNKATSQNSSYAVCHLSPDSTGDVEEKLMELCRGTSEKVCLVGLHACGDLSSAALDLFKNVSQLKLLTLLPCCYHKRALKDDRPVAGAGANYSDEDHFVNFPVSESLQDAVSLVENRTGCRLSKFLRRPFLRLAAQRSSEAWHRGDQVEQQQRLLNTLATASLYLLARQENVTLKKNKRRAVRRADWDCEEKFLSAAMNCYEFGPSMENGVPVEGKIVKFTKVLSIVKENRRHMRRLKVILALQAALQPVAESLVLGDLMAKLDSCEFENCRLVRLTDEVLSPRGVALVACKQ